MKIRTYTLTPEDLSSEYNRVKELFLTAMKNEKIITEEQEKEMNNYCIIFAQKGLFGKIWNKIFWNDDDKDNITFVKIIKQPK